MYGAYVMNDAYRGMSMSNYINGHDRYSHKYNYIYLYFICIIKFRPIYFKRPLVATMSDVPLKLSQPLPAQQSNIP